MTERLGLVDEPEKRKGVLPQKAVPGGAASREGVRIAPHQSGLPPGQLPPRGKPLARLAMTGKIKNKPGCDIRLAKGGKYEKLALL